MKKLAYTLLALTLILSACGGGKAQEAELQKQILDTHEKVMADDEKAMVNKMQLDTLIQKAIAAKTDSAQLIALRKGLNNADDAMGDWMKKFNADYTGKTHDQIIQYLNEQQLKVKQVDSMLINATKASADYLQKLKK